MTMTNWSKGLEASASALKRLHLFSAGHVDFVEEWMRGLSAAYILFRIRNQFPSRFHPALILHSGLG